MKILLKFRYVFIISDFLASDILTSASDVIVFSLQWLGYTVITLEDSTHSFTACAFKWLQKMLT